MRLNPAITPPTTLLLSLLALCCTLPAFTLAARPKNAILLSEVQSLTLHGPHQKTTSRRVPAIPQLRCVSPRALCQRYAAGAGGIRTMRCTNEGASYGGSQDIAWSCTAALPPTVRLDRTEVICEGYASADDDYVLRGSCGVEYTLALTEEGMRAYPELAKAAAREGGLGGGQQWAWLFWVVFVAVLVWIVYGAAQGPGRGGNRPLGGGNNRRGWGGGGGGGGWGPGWGPGGGGDDPPPPYPGSGPKPSSSTEQAWRPGFWSGVASGAAAGYMAGNRGQRNNDRYDNRGGGWGFGSGSAWGTGRSSSPDSGARHESTGYGSTSRR